MEGRLKRKKFDQKVYRKIITEMIITHDAPFSILSERYLENINAVNCV